MPAVSIEPREVCVGRADAIPPGEGRAFTILGRSIAVFRQRDGVLFATHSRCPHHDGPLADGLIGGGHVICPLHAYKFSLQTGDCANDPACRIAIYPVRESGGAVFVDMQAR